MLPREAPTSAREPSAAHPNLVASTTCLRARRAPDRANPPRRRNCTTRRCRSGDAEVERPVHDAAVGRNPSGRRNCCPPSPTTDTSSVEFPTLRCSINIHLSRDHAPTTVSSRESGRESGDPSCHVRRPLNTGSPHSRGRQRRDVHCARARPRIFPRLVGVATVAAEPLARSRTMRSTSTGVVLATRPAHEGVVLVADAQWPPSATRERQYRPLLLRGFITLTFQMQFRRRFVDHELQRALGRRASGAARQPMTGSVGLLLQVALPAYEFEMPERAGGEHSHSSFTLCSSAALGVGISSSTDGSPSCAWRQVAPAWKYRRGR